jgi:hypothetical protein
MGAVDTLKLVVDEVDIDGDIGQSILIDQRNIWPAEEVLAFNEFYACFTISGKLTTRHRAIYSTAPRYASSLSASLTASASSTVVSQLTSS